MPDAAAPSMPTLGRIVIFEEGFTAPAIVTKVEEAMEGIVPAVSLTVFPPDAPPISRRTVPHWDTLDPPPADGGTWRWPERV